MISSFYRNDIYASVLHRYAPLHRCSKEVVTSVPLFDVSHGNTPIKYVAMDVEINSKKMRFMVDTGATINLIKKSALNTLGETYH